MAITTRRRFANAGRLTDGTPYLPKDFKDQFDPSRFIEVYFGGKIYGARLATVRAVAYNADYFEKAEHQSTDQTRRGVDMGQLVDIAKTFKDKTASSIRSNSSDQSRWLGTLPLQNKGMLASLDFKSRDQ